MRIILAAALLAALASSASAAIVRLKGGGEARGTVVSTTATQVTVQTEGGLRVFPLDAVERIDYTDVPVASVPAPAAPYRFDEPLNVFALSLGLVAPTGGFSFGALGGGAANNGDVGPTIGARWLRREGPRLSLGIDFDYLNRTATTSPALVPNADAAVSGDSVVFLAVAKYALATEGRVRPYLLAGAGPHRTTTIVDAQPRLGFAWTDTNTDEPRRLVDGGGWGAALAARVGLDFEFWEPATFSVEAGWLGTRGASADATPQGKALGIVSAPSSFDAFVLAARWGWGF